MTSVTKPNQLNYDFFRMRKTVQTHLDTQRTRVLECLLVDMDEKPAHARKTELKVKSLLEDLTDLLNGELSARANAEYLQWYPGQIDASLRDLKEAVISLETKLRAADPNVLLGLTSSRYFRTHFSPFLIASKDTRISNLDALEVSKRRNKRKDLDLSVLIVQLDSLKRNAIKVSAWLETKPSRGRRNLPTKKDFIGRLERFFLKRNEFLRNRDSAGEKDFKNSKTEFFRICESILTQSRKELLGKPGS